MKIVAAAYGDGVSDRLLRAALAPLRLTKNAARLLRSALMADFLTAYSITQPDKAAVIDDRPDGTITTLTFSELNEQANRLANVLLDLGARPGETKVVWCGQNSPGLAVMINAARKLGVTAVPLNYRLSDEEAAYVTDHCDAGIVYVDAEYAPMFERIRADLPKVQHYLVFDGKVPDGMRASKPPDAISPAVVATREMGRSSRRLVDQPSAPAKIVVTAMPIASAVPMARNALSVSLSGTASKYWALAAGMSRPTAIYGSPLKSNRCVALPPRPTNAISSGGYDVCWNAAFEFFGS